MKYSEKDIEFANQIITRRNELDNELVEAWMSDPLHVEMLKEFVAIREKYTNWDFEVIKGEERERLQQAISRRKKVQGGGGRVGYYREHGENTYYPGLEILAR